MLTYKDNYPPLQKSLAEEPIVKRQYEKVRDSNFELLRLISMIMILALHANHQSLGEPTSTAAIANPFQMWTKEFLQQVCDVGVNVFVLISGWFGIRPKKKSFFKLVFQIMFYSVGLFLIMFIMGFRLPFLKNIQLFWLGSGYWFVPAYLILYAFSPVLNAFIENSTRSVVRNFLLFFFFLELLYGWAFDDFANFDGGYSALSFFFLYLLARYINIYKPSIIKLDTIKMLGLFFLICFAGSLITLGSLLSGISFLAEHIHGKMQIYTSPFVIIPSVLLILIFSKVKIQSKIINWLASSCFAIFLIHTHLMVKPTYNEVCRLIFNNNSGFLYLLIIFMFINSVALGCILIDKLRILCWNKIENKYR